MIVYSAVGRNPQFRDVFLCDQKILGGINNSTISGIIQWNRGPWIDFRYAY